MDLEHSKKYTSCYKCYTETDKSLSLDETSHYNVRLLLRVEEHRTRHQKRMQMREIYSQIIST